MNGPSLNLLGQREPEKYGHKTLSDLEKELSEKAQALQVELSFFQSNSEGGFVEKIHAAKAVFDALIINAAAYTHTSVAIRDALLATAIPFIEVHISNVYKREDFRHKSYLSDIAEGVIVGLGTQGYELAMRAWKNKAEEKND